jgi:hypothetical protein
MQKSFYMLALLALLALMAGCAAGSAPKGTSATAEARSKPLPGVFDATDRACPEPRGDAMVTRRSSVSSRVTNGTTYDCGAIELDSVERVIVPTDAVVERVPAGDVIVIRTRRALNFAGHTGSRELDLTHARHNMGIAWTLRGRTVQIGTFGEFDTGIEGGATLSLHIDLPENIESRESADISGPWSIASARTETPEFTRGVWFGPTLPAMNWHSIPERPDPTGRARPVAYWDGGSRGAPDNARKVLRDCVETHARRGESLAGALVADIRFEQPWRTNSVRYVRNTVRPPDIADCVRRGLGELSPPRHLRRDVTVRMRFVFE